MTATNHALTGAVVALVIKKPELAIPLAFLSHIVVDMVPHFDAGPKPAWLFKVVVAIDCTTAAILAIVFTLFLKTSIPGWIIFASMAAAVSPDLVWGWRYYKLHDVKKIIQEPMSFYSRYHQKIQWSETRMGILVEIPWLILMSALIDILRR